MNILDLGWRFDHNIDNVSFPDNLHTLNLGNYFNHNIDNVKFPNNLHTLQFGGLKTGGMFNHTIDNVRFPINLHTLQICGNFNRPIDNVKFPADLHTLQFGGGFDQSIDNVKFPDNLYSLCLVGLSKKFYIIVECKNLHILKIGISAIEAVGYDISFLENIHTIDLTHAHSLHMSKIQLPLTLKELIIRSEYKLPYGCIETLIECKLNKHWQ